jgi:single-strand DNA-binding protein
MAKKDHNKASFIGNLGRDPEMRYTPSGKPVTNFSVAVNNQYAGADGQVVKETLWVKAVTWGATAEAANKYLKKGMQVYIEGRINPIKIWTGTDGEPRADLELTVSEMQFLSHNDGSSGSAPEIPGAPDPEDIPF